MLPQRFRNRLRINECYGLSINLADGTLMY